MTTPKNPGDALAPYTEADLKKAHDMLDVLSVDGTARMYNDMDYAHTILLKCGGLFARLVQAALTQKPSVGEADLSGYLKNLRKFREEYINQSGYTMTGRTAQFMFRASTKVVNVINEIQADYGPDYIGSPETKAFNNGYNAALKNIAHALMISEEDKGE